MKLILVLFISMWSCVLHAQKQIDKIFDVATLTTLSINGDNCFKIRVKTSQTNQIKIQAVIEGEHSEDVIIVAKKNADSLLVSTRFQPLFKADNDKLSAHKIMSIELDFEIPEHLKLYIQSDIGSVEATGNFKTAIIELNQGNCTLHAFSGSSIVNTVNGSILVEINDAKVHAYSRHGEVNIQPLVKGENELDLKSIHGNISVIKTE